MKKNSILILFLFLFLFVFVLLSGCGQAEDSDVSAPDPVQAFYSSITSDYPLSVMESLSAFGANPDLGFRTSGSVAELAASEYLYNEMQDMGLQNVASENVTVDSWEFTKAELRYGDDSGGWQTIVMASYATNYDCDDEEMALVYAGKGTDKDYEGLDVAGKLVLIDIDQEADWRICWPAYQAKVKGAQAVIAVNTGEYFQYNDDALGISNICGPDDAPAFAVSLRDGNTLKWLIGDSEDGEIKVRLTADSKIEPDKTAYSIIGEIPGSSDSALYMIAHYDGYFDGYYDDASGVGAVLGIAKALVDSGYVPEKTIRIVLHPAGEWGLINSRYDWATGAYRTVNDNYDWAENAFALINIDGGVTGRYADGIEISASPELRNFIDIAGFDVDGSPFSGFNVVSLRAPLTEEFVYAQKGAPVLRSGFSGRYERFDEIYHTNKDSANYFYDENEINFAQKLYGTLLIELDRQPVKPLDYTALFEDIMAAADSQDQPDADALREALYDAADAAGELSGKIEKGGFSDEAAGEYNDSLFKISKTAQDRLMALTWDDELVFANERYLRNVSMIKSAIEALRRGDIDASVEDYLSKIDLNRYANYFDRETYDFFVSQVLGPEAENSWGSGYLKDNSNLYDVVRGIRAKSESGEPVNYIDEIEALGIELVNQQRLLADTTARMIKDIISLTADIDRLNEM